jgi:hypothetical protein
MLTNSRPAIAANSRPSMGFWTWLILVEVGLAIVVRFQLCGAHGLSRARPAEYIDGLRDLGHPVRANPVGGELE